MSRSLSWIEPDLLRLWLDETAPASDQVTHLEDARLVPPEEAPSAEAPSPRTIHARVAHLARWLTELLGGRPFFVADQDGLSVWRHEVPGHRVLASHIERALAPVARLLGGGMVAEWSVCIGDHARFSVIWCETSMGRMALGVYGEPALSKEEVAWIREAMGQVFDPGL
ncbi:MAG: hypothetical protein ACFB9M_05965 [Myxococcota bacterium]